MSYIVVVLIAMASVVDITVDDVSMVDTVFDGLWCGMDLPDLRVVVVVGTKVVVGCFRVVVVV